MGQLDQNSAIFADAGSGFGKGMPADFLSGMEFVGDGGRTV